MHVSHLVTANVRGGMIRLIKDLCVELERAGINNSVTFPPGNHMPEVLQDYHDVGIDAVSSSMMMHMHSKRSPRTLQAFTRLILNQRADLINIHYGTQHVPLPDIIASRLSRKPIVISHLHYTPSNDISWRRQLLSRISWNISDAITVSSPLMLQNVVKMGGPIRKIYEMPHGVLNPSFAPSQLDARTHLNLPTEAFIIVSVARLEWNKGFLDLINSVAGLSQLSQPCHLVIAGDGSARSQLEAMAAANLGERAHFLGFVSDNELPYVYAAGDVFALPSYEEGFGLVYIEAAMYGLTSVGARVGGVPYAIIDGETGVLVPPRDPVALTDALDRLRHDPVMRLQLGASAQRRAKSEFSLSQMGYKYASMLKEVCR